jgi:hypothetical protein
MRAPQKKGAGIGRTALAPRHLFGSGLCPVRKARTIDRLHLRRAGTKPLCRPNREFRSMSIPTIIAIATVVIALGLIGATVVRTLARMPIDIR